MSSLLTSPADWQGQCNNRVLDDKRPRGRLTAVRCIVDMAEGPEGTGEGIDLSDKESPKWAISSCWTTCDIAAVSVYLKLG